MNTKPNWFRIFPFFLVVLLMFSCFGSAQAEAQIFSKVYSPLILRNSASVLRGVQIEKLPLAGREQWLVPSTVVSIAVKWGQVERVRGIYEWPTYLDNDIAILGNQILMLRVQGAPKWARYPDKLACDPFQPQYYADFGKFIQQLLDKYPQTRYVELWNEPDLKFDTPYREWWNGCNWSGYQYAAMTQVIYPIITRPELTIVCGALAYPEYGFWDDTERFDPVCDAVSFHAYVYYRGGNELHVETDAAILHRLTSLPLFLTETSLLNFSPTSTKFEQAQGEFAQYVYDIAHKAEINMVLWYTLGYMIMNGWGNSDLVWHGVPRPAWYVYANP